ncbi:MAG: hypothetical protein PHV13_00560 [Candidatus ainarchaeum sp.]|nr:hypothetical protein [Candidatus ainarchaeum sp.]
MKTLFIVLAALLASPLAYASCNSDYEQCITNCCYTCGSTLGTDANGELVCNAGTADNPDQACISACLPCSDAYQQCIANEGGASFGTGASCCGAAALLLTVLGGVAFVRSRR